METRQENIDTLIMRFLNGECTPDEEIYISRWVSDSTANCRFFAMMRDIWMASGQDSEAGQRMAAEELDRFRKSVGSGTADTTPPSRRQRRHTGFSIALFTAAAAILAFGIFLWVGQARDAGHVMTAGQTEKPDSSAVVVFETKPGSIAGVTLPDGTKVKLNSGSILSYAASYGYNGGRSVDLSGEAFFEVSSDISRPFTVYVRGFGITATGTSFNVCGYDSDLLLKTTLEEGRISITGITPDGMEINIPVAPKETVMLMTGTSSEGEYLDEQERSALGKMQLNNTFVASLPDVNTKLYTSWKDEQWMIDRESLGSLSEKFSRRYNVRITFGDQQAAQYNFTGTLSNETIEEIMAIMHQAMPIKYRINKGNIHITSDQARQ